jgi:hypothetical protein
MFRLIYFILFTLLISNSSYAIAESVKKEFKFTEAFSTDISKTFNKAAVNANSKIRNSMQGRLTSIPLTWRLINGAVKPNGEYVLFFQDKDGAVYTLEVSASGLINGGNLLSIPSHP